jgi:transcriptional regulator with XRE-family HTH domain
MMLNSKSIGNKIAEARKKNNLSQAELANKISISPQAVGKWERGESMPDITTLNRLAEIFGLDLNYFSDNFQSIANESQNDKSFNEEFNEQLSSQPKKRFNWNWDMSNSNWVDADFSGLKDLKDKFSSSNIKNCKFVNSDLSEITLKSNCIDICDFSHSNFIFNQKYFYRIFSH